VSNVYLESYPIYLNIAWLVVIKDAFPFLYAKTRLCLRIFLEKLCDGSISNFVCLFYVSSIMCKIKIVNKC